MNQNINLNSDMNGSLELILKEMETISDEIETLLHEEKINISELENLFSECKHEIELMQQKIVEFHEPSNQVLGDVNFPEQELTNINKSVETIENISESFANEKDLIFSNFKSLIDKIIGEKEDYYQLLNSIENLRT